MTNQSIDQWTPKLGPLQQRIDALVREVEARRLDEIRRQVEPLALAELRAEHEAELERRAAREQEIRERMLRPGQITMPRRLPTSGGKGRPDIIVESVPIWGESSSGRVRGVKPPLER